MNTLPFGWLTNGWFIPPPTIGYPKTDYEVREIVAPVGLTANTPKEAVYLDGMLDADGIPAHRCQALYDDIQGDAAVHQARLLGPADVRCDEFLPRPESAQSLYVIGSDSKHLKYNADGSLTFYLQSDNPGGDKESNWLPAPNGPVPRDPRHLCARPGAHRLTLRSERLHASAGPGRRDESAAYWNDGEAEVKNNSGDGDLHDRHRCR